MARRKRSRKKDHEKQSAPPPAAMFEMGSSSNGRTEPSHGGRAPGRRPAGGLGVPLDAPDCEGEVADPPTRVVHFNVRFIVTLVAALAILGVGVHFLHAYQVDRNADALLVRAAAARGDDDAKQAIALLSQYIHFRPRDADALATLGTLLDDGGKSPRQWFGAQRVLEQALRIDPERDDARDIRRRLVDLTMKLRRYGDALAHLDKLTAGAPNDAELLWLTARCHRAQGKYDPALASYLQALSADSKTIKYYVELASLVSDEPARLPTRERLAEDSALGVAPEWLDLFPGSDTPVDDASNGRDDAAAPKASAALPSFEAVAAGVVGRLLQRMVEDARPRHEAHLARAGHFQGRREFVKARDDVQEALELAPENPDVLVAAADLALARAEFARTARKPAGDEVPEPNTGPAAAERFLDEARMHIESGLQLPDPDPRLHLARARVELFRATQTARADEQRQHYGKAGQHLHDGLTRLEQARQNPESDTARLNEIELYLRWTLADVLTIRASLDPDNSNALLAEAEDLLKTVREKNIRPELAAFLEGSLHFARGSWSDAAATLEATRHGLRNRPDLVRRGDLMLGACYERLANPDQRRDVFRRALKEDAGWTQGWLLVADTFVDENRIDEAIREYGHVPRVPGVATAVARLLLMKELSRPAGERDFRAVRRALDAADQTAPGAAAQILLRADLFALEAAALQERITRTGDVELTAARDQNYQRAQTLIDSALAAHPDEPALWAARANLASRNPGIEPAERLDAAQRVLDDAREKIGLHSDLLLSAATVATQKPRDEARAALAAIEASSGDLEPADRARCLQGLARHWAALGERDKAVALWMEIAALQPDSLSHRLTVAELALQTDDQPLFDQSLAAIRKLEGKGGPNGNLLAAAAQIQTHGRAYQSRLKSIRDSKAAAEERTTQLRQAREQLIKQLAEPRRLLAAAARRRPYWAAVPRVLGNIEMLLGNREGAVDHYRQAIELGSRSATTVREVVDFLYTQRKFSEADQILKTVAQDAPQLISGDVARLAAGVAVQQGGIDEALKIAESLAATSNNYRDKLSEAQLRLAKDGASSDVLSLLEQALELALQHEPSAAHRPYLTLVAYYNSRLGKPDDAKAFLTQAAEKLPADPPYLKPLAVARAWEIAGDTGQAGQHYQAALATDPSNAELRMALADYYVRSNQPQQADMQLDVLLDEKTKAPDFAVDWARRQKAAVIAAPGTYQDVQKAREYLDRTVRRTGGEPSVADLRAQAALLSRLSTRRDRLELIKLLEQMERRGGLAPRERFELARLYEATRNWEQARATFRALIQSDPGNPVYLFDFAYAALERGGLDDALRVEVEDAVNRLASLEPNSFRTAAATARLRHDQGRDDEAVTVLQQYLDRLASAPPEQAFRDLVEQKKPQEAFESLAALLRDRRDEGSRQVLDHVQQLIEQNDIDEALASMQRFLQASDIVEAVQSEFVRIVAGLLESIGQYVAAEVTFRDYAARSKRPEAPLVLASYFARRGRIGEALDLCERAWNDASPVSAASVSVGVLRAASPTPGHIERVESRLQAAIDAAAPAQWMPLVQRMADLRDLQGRHDEAAAIYRQILERHPNSVLALNNLAWMLCFKPQARPEALLLINRAIELAGPIAALRDTRAVVYLSTKTPAPAIADLEAALDEVGDASIFYHLAQAHASAGNLSAARQALQDARQAGFEESNLHPLEHPGHEDLLRKLGQ